MVTTSQTLAGLPAGAAQHVVLIGGGISGLSTAYYLLKQARAEGRPLHCTLLESAAQLGGKIKTVRVTTQDDAAAQSLVVEAGPESFVTRKPWAYELCRELGLADRLLAADDAGRNYVLHHGVPTQVPTKPQGFLKTPLLSWAGKLRAARELRMPARAVADDEALGDFVQRHFGREVLENLVAPAVGSIYLSDVNQLSTQVSFERFLKLEQTTGSVLKGMMAAQKAAKQAAKAATTPRPKLPPFVTLPNGLGEWVDALAARLREMGGTLRTNAAVSQLNQEGSGRWQIELQSGEMISADAVVLAVPAFAMADLIAPHDARSAAYLRGVRYISVATVTLGFPRAAIGKPFEGFGVVVPEREDSPLLACEVMSNKWPARQHASAQSNDVVLFRAFLGGHRNEAQVAQSDAVLIEHAKTALARIFEIQGEPVAQRVFRWQPGNPQYPVGHLQALAEIETNLAQTMPNVFLTGAAMRGLGLPDCVRQARETAAQVLAATSLRPSQPVAVEREGQR